MKLHILFGEPEWVYTHGHIDKAAFVAELPKADYQGYTVEDVGYTHMRFLPNRNYRGNEVADGDGFYIESPPGRGAFAATLLKVE
jgi:hypothetical protein